MAKSTSWLPGKKTHRWRYEPLGPERFPLGAGPFRSRGLAYVHVLHYVDSRIEGGRRALLDHLGPDDPFAAFYGQIFLVAGDYDVSPLLRLFIAAAELKGVDPGAFIQRRAARSGDLDTKGIWKPALSGRTPMDVARRLNFAFARYYPPCNAGPLSSEPGRFVGELRGLPGCMNGLYVDSTMGFYVGALEGAGARNVEVTFEAPVSDGATEGIGLERVRFEARWVD